jgi:hypothetical protein
MTIRYDRYHRHVSTFALALVAALGLSSPACDAETTASEPPALREAALEEGPNEAESDTPAETPETTSTPAPDDAAESSGSATPTAPAPTVSGEQSEAEFEAEVERLMTESEAFRNAMASVRVYDTLPDDLDLVRAEHVEPPGRMRCNEPLSAAERNRAPIVEVHGDPAREVSLLARLAALKPGDLETAQETTAPAEPDAP